MNIYNEENFTKEAWKSLINTDWKDIRVMSLINRILRS